MCLPDLFWRMGEDGKITSTCVEGFLLGGRFKCRNMGWPSHQKQKKNFFINNAVGLSMGDYPIETVKYIWVKIWCILNWILSQNCITSFAYSSWTTRSAKTYKAVVPNQLLQPTPAPLLTRWKNTIKIQVYLWFCIVWTVFNTRTTWHFHY